MLWVPVTIGAAVSQLARNALQSGLVRSVGTPAATMVRFLYALPFALIAYAVALFALGQTAPPTGAPTIGWALLGAVAQIAATGLMLKAMDMRGFAVAYTYIKTEPVLLALGGWWLLGDVLPPLAWLGILLATAGVIWAALPEGKGMAALHVMLFTLTIQTALMLGWLGLTDRNAIRATLTAWRPSLAAGFTGALATLFWFTGFALTAAANVRTLGLIEMPLAAFLNRRVSGKALGSREWAGIALVAAGIVLLVRSAA